MPKRRGNREDSRLLVRKPLPKLKKELDVIFSRFIRYRDKGVCYTCGHSNDPKKMQCGHFVPRQYLSVRYDERNCHCQCYACNMLFNGQPSAYAMRLEQDFGKGIVEELESQRRAITKLTPDWYEEKIAHYKALVKSLEA